MGGPMQDEIIRGLFENIQLLFVLMVLYQLKYYIGIKSGRVQPIFKGIIIGIIGIFVMTFPYTFQNGLSIDARSVLISSVALFVSIPALLISSSMMLIYNIYLGGTGMVFGSMIILFSTAFGILWRKAAFERKYIPRWLNIYFYAVLIHSATISLLNLLFSELATQTLQALSMPIIVIYPVITVIISALFLVEKQNDDADALILESEQKYLNLFNNQHTAMLVIDPKNGQIIDANPAALSFYGWSKEVLLTKKIADINMLSSQEVQHEMDEASKQNKSSFMFKHRKANGNIVDVEVFSGPFVLNKKPLLYSIVVDVSKRSISEEESAKNLDLFHKVVENSLDAIYIEVGRRFVYLNPAALRLFKVQDEMVMIGMKILDRIHPDYHQEVNHVMSLSNQNRSPFSNSQWVYLTINNKPVTVESVAVPIVYNNQRGMLVITHDITNRLETLSALLSSEMNFRSVVKNMPIPIFIHQNGKIAFLNRAAERFLGSSSDEDLMGSPFSSYVPKNDVDGILSHIKKATDHKKEISIPQQQFLRADGSPVFAQVGAVHINYDGVSSDLIFARDLTEELEMEKRKAEWEMQIQQKQRLESVGVLAGGIAHEINNPINGIMNYAQLIIDEAQQDDIIDDYVNQILKESQRISDIVKSLLQFSRHEKHAYSFSSMYDIIENTLLLIKVIFKNDQIDLRLTFEEDLPDIKCRSQQIQQVFMNLMTNARDALNEKYPGYHEQKIIEVDVSCKHHDDHRWIHLSVKDYGMGIPDEVKKRIFEPFFSTKPKHIGTGLGLAISFGIIENHHGKILIDSAVGEYSIFTIMLPVDNGWELLPERR
jgi:PAS domain S-box-containing protein